jgi:hypothetical protein
VRRAAHCGPPASGSSPSSVGLYVVVSCEPARTEPQRRFIARLRIRHGPDNLLASTQHGARHFGSPSGPPERGRTIAKFVLRRRSTICHFLVYDPFCLRRAIAAQRTRRQCRREFRNQPSTPVKLEQSGGIPRACSRRSPALPRGAVFTAAFGIETRARLRPRQSSERSQTKTG